MLADYDDPIVEVLALLSAMLRVAGNIVKLFKIIGGRIMNILKIIKDTIVKKLANVVETPLVVGNLGEISYLATSYEGSGRFPLQNPYNIK